MKIDTSTPKRPTIRTYTDTAHDYVNASLGSASAAQRLNPTESNAPHRPTPQTIAANHALQVRQACHTLREVLDTGARRTTHDAISELLDALGELETPAEQIARQSAATTN